jgi:hypothetical protein
LAVGDRFGARKGPSLLAVTGLNEFPPTCIHSSEVAVRLSQSPQKARFMESYSSSSSQSNVQEATSPPSHSPTTQHHLAIPSADRPPAPSSDHPSAAHTAALRPAPGRTPSATAAWSRPSVHANALPTRSSPAATVPTRTWPTSPARSGGNRGWGWGVQFCVLHCGPARVGSGAASEADGSSGGPVLGQPQNWIRAKAHISWCYNGAISEAWRSLMENGESAAPVVEYFSELAASFS